MGLIYADLDSGEYNDFEGSVGHNPADDLLFKDSHPGDSSILPGVTGPAAGDSSITLLPELPLGIDEVDGLLNDVMFVGTDARIEADKESPAGRDSDIPGQPNDYPAWVIDFLPDRFSLNDSSLKVEGDFARILKKTADFDVPGWLEDLAGKVKSIQVETGKHAFSVKAEGDQEIELKLPGMERFPITMKSPSLKIKLDPSDKDKIEITDIEGAESALGKISAITMRLERDGQDRTVWKIQVTHRAAEAKPDSEDSPDALTSLTGGLQSFGKSIGRAYANSKEFEIPLDNKEAAENSRLILDYAGKWSDMKNFDHLLELADDETIRPVVGAFLKGINGVSKGEGGVVTIERDGSKTIEVGALSFSLDKTIKMKLAKTRKGDGLAGDVVSLSDISGIKAGLPLPAQLLERLGIPADVRLSELSLSERRPDGSRELTLKTRDHGSLRLSIGRDGQPVLENGKLSVDVDAVAGGKTFPITVVFDPEQAVSAGAAGPDFVVKVRGDGKAVPELLKSLAGGDIGPLSNLSSGLKEMRRQGDMVTLIREKKSAVDMGGLVVDVAKEVSFKVRESKGIKIEDIKGLSYKFKLDIPALNNALGLPRETRSTHVRSVQIDNPDRSGQQRMVVRGDGPVSDVAIFFKNDKIVTNPNDGNRGSIYARVRQLQTEKEKQQGKPQAYFSLILKVDENGNPKMTTSEIAELAAEAVYAAINKDKFRGYEPIQVNGNELFTAASKGRNQAPVVHIPGYDLKVRMHLPNYRGDRGVVLYHDGSHLRAVGPDGDEWQLYQAGSYRQSRDKHNPDKTVWVKTEGKEFHWVASNKYKDAPVVTIPGFQIDVRMHFPGYGGETVRILKNGNGQIHALGSNGMRWELKQAGGYNQSRDARNPNKTYWQRIR